MFTQQQIDSAAKLFVADQDAVDDYKAGDCAWQEAAEAHMQSVGITLPCPFNEPARYDALSDAFYAVVDRLL